LSAGGIDTVTALPAIFAPAHTGRMCAAISPMRPWASCTVATPNGA
jgi:hypothetical protein